MVEPSNPLTDNLKDAFLRAVVKYADDWGFGEPEPDVFFGGKIHTISAICRFVLEHKDEDLPAGLPNVLWRLADENRRDLKGDLSKDSTYHGGARCLRELVSSRSKRFG